MMGYRRLRDSRRKGFGCKQPNAAASFLAQPIGNLFHHSERDQSCGLRTFTQRVNVPEPYHSQPACSSPQGGNLPLVRSKRTPIQGFARPELYRWAILRHLP